MAKYYAVANLSENIAETPEGFLICRDVALARSGELEYLPSEIDGASKEKSVIKISRTIDELASDTAIASIEGKSVTLTHPYEFVSPHNWQDVTVGIIQNVRVEEDKLIADLLITGFEAIQAIKNKTMRELSLGYSADIDLSEDKTNGTQKNIIVNHVAIVQSGRCGSDCAIFDHRPKEKKMSFKDKFFALLDSAESDGEEKKAEKVESEKVEPSLEAVENAVAEIEEGLEIDANKSEKLADRLSHVKKTVEKLQAKIKDSETKLLMDSLPCKDKDTISKAEIIFSGVEKTGNVKKKALDLAYTTEKGKVVIDSVLGGKPLADADLDIVFNAVASIIGSSRTKQMDSIANFSESNLESGVMTPQKLQENFNNHYKGQS